MDKITCFSDWWKKYSKEYEGAGVNYIVAKSIWDAACDVYSEQVLEQVKKELRSK